MTQTETKTLAARDNDISDALVDARRLLDAMNKFVEDYVDESLEAREPLLGLVSAIRDRSTRWKR